MSKNKSMKYQAQGILKPMLRLGESKHDAKLKAEDKHHIEGIFSVSTYKNYVTVAAQFGNWAKKTHGEKDLKNCRQYVPEYLQIRIDKGLSPYTISKDASALAKLYNCRKEDFGIEIPQKHRIEIKRSRAEIKEFDYAKHKDLLDFINGTGLRHSELEKVKKENFYSVKGDLFVRVTGKGGKERVAKILPQYRNVVETRLVGLNDSDKVFRKGDIPCRTPCHAYRAKYAKDFYNMIARPLNTLAKKEKYICRKDKKGIVYDRQALRVVSKMLGHNRLSVIVDHYLY